MRQFIYVILVLSLLLAACSKKDEQVSSPNATAQQTQQSTDSKSPSESQEDSLYDAAPNVQDEVNDQLKEAAEDEASPEADEAIPEEAEQETTRADYAAMINAGKIMDSEVGIGDSTAILNKEQAAVIDYLEGGLYFSYDQLVYFSDAFYDEEWNIVDGTISVIGVFEGEEVYGLKLGASTIEEAKSIFGSNFIVRSPEEHMDNFLLSDYWAYEFEYEHNNLILTTEEQGGVIKNAYLWANVKQ